MRSHFLLLLVGLAFAGAACGGPGEVHTPGRSSRAEQWLNRARASYKVGDFEDASESGKHALEAAPRDPEIRTLNARVALTKLDFAEALKLTEGLDSTEAHGIRGRAFWYSGDIDPAADELEAMLQDPRVKDPWARDVARLARRGSGRHPFAMEGGVVAVVDMPRALANVALGPAHVVPCEMEGERILALIATGASEVLIDSTSRKEPAWVSFRFGNQSFAGQSPGQIEVKDVPALTGDLSTVSRQLGVPIKAMLGSNLLRHTHATFDRRGDQFIIRQQDPIAPPDASRVPLWYVRGGGMTVRATIKNGDDGMAPLYVDSTRFMPLALDDAAWKRAGVDVKTLSPLPDAPNLRRGMMPVFKLGGFDLAGLPAWQGLDLSELSTNTELTLGGVLGAELLAFFRVTFADEGRFMWIEVDPTLIAPARPTGPTPPPPPARDGGSDAPPPPRGGGAPPGDAGAAPAGGNGAPPGSSGGGGGGAPPAGGKK